MLIKSKAKKLNSLLILSSISLGTSVAYAQQCQAPIWSDEFNGTQLNQLNWEAQIGDGCDQGAGMCGWGNSELQSYQAENAVVQNGQLTITAKKQRIKGTQYTSARLRTANMPGSGEWSFGRIEARMKVPSGQGMWPAFWMLPTDPVNTWPISGEIDIFESTGQSSMLAFGTIHYGQPYPNNSHTGGSILKQPNKWSDNFHTYAIEWEADEIRWYVDNLLYSTKTIADVAPEDWPFDGRNNFHILFNLAVGGTWGGDVDDSALPQTLEVDYVRVYSSSQPSLQGEHLVAPGSTQTYTLNNGAATNWQVTGGTIISSNNNSVDVMWDQASAASNQTVTAVTSACSVQTDIYVGPELTTETVLENFNGNSAMTVTSSNGSYDVSNGVLTYTRDGASQYDVIVASTAAIPDAGQFVTGSKSFSMDFNNTNPSLVGKQVLIQLENSSVATPSNYPGGRHSKYEAFIEHANGWQTLQFKMADRIDTATADTAVDNVIILIDPNTFTNDTYVIDNIEILGESTGPVNTPPTAAFNNNCTDLNCSFNATASSDSDGNIVSYAWDFGDGNTATGESVNHTFSSANTYTVSLTVTDNQGATDTIEQQVVVTSGGTEDAVSSVVSSVVTGTEGAGRGKKSGTATVTLLDNLGAPIAGAQISGNFSGTWNESAQAVTDANGVAVFATSSAASGAVSVNFCVNDVQTTLPLDVNASTGVCL
ncbi:family 16 glycosylhydrolase [Thalassotalea aquiviva]|uniref:family 16 glycosylhydrolase n=1 Tax=Thalassotalea aquiviva TaxID=3242415 RepID=UPI003529E3E9